MRKAYVGIDLCCTPPSTVSPRLRPQLQPWALWHRSLNALHQKARTSRMKRYYSASFRAYSLEGTRLELGILKDEPLLLVNKWGINKADPFTINETGEVGLEP